MNCEDLRENLIDFVEGVMPPEAAASVRSHVESCAACRERVRSTRDLVGALSAARSLDRTKISDPDRTRPLLPQQLKSLSLIGDFEIQEELGRGGMGVVYRARQLSLNRIVALKVLSAAGLQDERAIERFKKEAQAAARLHHTNIVPIYAQGCEQGYFYYAMELVEGRSLDRAIRDDDPFLRKSHTIFPGRSAASAIVQAAGHAEAGISQTRRTSSPRDFKRIARMIAEVADALQHAHDQGIVHRDIKPQNLMLGADDRLHITDFGLARILDEQGLTLSAEMVGTPAYMAPEQIRGGRTVDARADIYSLGVTLYELLTKTRPFSADNYEGLMDQVLRKEPRPPRRFAPAVPPDLETICLRAMEKEPARRFSSAADMGRDLRRYAEDFPIASRRVGPLGRMARWVRRNRALASALAAAVLVAVLAPLVLVLFHALANRRIEAAENRVYEDYREVAPIREALGWASRVGGDRDRADIVRAATYVRENPRLASEIIDALLEREPEHRDAMYLLAWCCLRRAESEGPAMQTRALEVLRKADGLGIAGRETSALGDFFHGVALMGYDAISARTCFEAAGNSRSGFTQAALHKARAENTAIYFLRTLDYYVASQRSLEFICQGLQKKAAYPRYLLAFSHSLAGEVLGERGDAAARDRAFSDAVIWAKSAQGVEPDNPRGYIGHAQVLEAMAWFENQDRNLLEVVACYHRLDRLPPGCVRPSDKQERERYEARIQFWLGNDSQAEALAKNRYGDGVPPQAESWFDFEGVLIRSLLLRTSGNEAAARLLLEKTRSDFAEQAMILAAAWRLNFSTVPVSHKVAGADFDKRLSDGWTPAWTRKLHQYCEGNLDWAELFAAARIETTWPGDDRRRLSAAYFHRGVIELAAGRRSEARDSFLRSWEMRDFENYCYLSKLILLKLDRDPNWPHWIKPSDAAGPPVDR